MRFKNLNQKARDVEKRLNSIGIKVIRFYAESDLYDPQLEICENLHIQIGVNYICIVKHNADGTLSIFNSANNIKSIMKSLKEAVNEG